MKKTILTILEGDLARSGGLIFLSSLFANIVLFFANLFIANLLGPVDFGVFKVITYLFTFIPLLIEFGISVSLTKYISEFKSRSREKLGYLIKRFLEIRILIYSLSIAIILLLNEQIAVTFLGESSLSYLILAGILLSGMTFFSVFQAIVLGFHEFKLYSLSQFLTLSISAFLGILLSPLGLFYIIVGWSFGSLIGNAFNLRFFIRKNLIRKTKKFDIKKIFVKFSLPVYFVWIVTSLYAVIIPILSVFFPPEPIGYFSFAFLFYFATLMIPTAIASVVFPKVSELNGSKRYRDAKNIKMKAFMLYIPVVLIGMLFVLLASDWLFNSFFQEYLPSLLMFKVLVSLGLLFGFNTIYTNYLQGLGRIKRFAVIVLTQNILLFAVSFGLLSTL